MVKDNKFVIILTVELVFGLLLPRTSGENAVPAKRNALLLLGEFVLCFLIQGHAK